MSKTLSKGKVSMNKGGLYETVTQRLQKDADNYTKQLENQKRNENKMKIDLQKETRTLKEMRDKARENRPATQDDRNKAANIKRLENQLDKEIVTYNQTVADNKKLQKEIDKYRKDKKAADEILLKLIKQKQNIEGATTVTTQKRNKDKAAIEDATMTTVLIKSTYGKKKEEYNKNIDRLKERLQERLEDQKEDERNRGRELEKIGGDQANPLDIITHRLDNWKAKVRHKKETLDLFTKHINIIRDAFGQIKKASGISNLNEIVTTFIKAQEQSDGLNSHLNFLDKEIDSLEEQKQGLRKELKTKQDTINNYNANDKSMAAAFKIQKAELSKKTKMKDEELDKAKKTVNNIQVPVSKMLNNFGLSSIALSVAEDKIYNETTTFNEQNVNGYLAEVEEYIKCLLTLIGKQHGFEHPMLTALGLEDLPAKFEPPNLPKEVPNDGEEEEEEPDDQTLNDMLDPGKFDKMMEGIMEKKIEASKSQIQEPEKDEKVESPAKSPKTPTKEDKKPPAEKQENVKAVHN
jgi:chromosome segregation ATPase